MRVMEIVLRVLMIAILVLCLAVPVFAAFQGPGASEATVQQAKNMPNDAIVTLTGNVISQVTGTDDEYLFRDGSGEIVVEIDNKYFRGQTVTPANRVRITGEVDKDFGRNAKIDVKRLELLN